eukprot:6030487-Pyramimonas_sp.AAC.1
MLQGEKPALKWMMTGHGPSDVVGEGRCTYHKSSRPESRLTATEPVATAKCPHAVIPPTYFATAQHNTARTM